MTARELTAHNGARIVLKRQPDGAVILFTYAAFTPVNGEANGIFVFEAAEFDGYFAALGYQKKDAKR